MVTKFPTSKIGRIIQVKGEGDSLINYNEMLKGLYGDQLERVNEINNNYKLYEGDQGWATNPELDYIPTKKITNYIKKLIDTKARFMFGKEPFFDVRQIKTDGKNNTIYADEAQEKEDLLHDILKDNKFHSKLLKAKKDCSIGGKVAIKLWGHKDYGLKIIFSPAQEFFTQYNIDDVDTLEKIIFLYALNNEKLQENQRVKKQEWEMIDSKCILNEGLYDGNGRLIESLYENYDTGLKFIPVIVIQNGGLTGETEGVSDVEQLWHNQDAYNKLTSDDIDALKFQMFGQDVVTDADEKSLDKIKVAPGAMIDLQTDMAQASQGRQAKIERLESGFSYKDKFEDTVNRIKNDMFDVLDVPNISLDQLKGLMTSGKSMRALYWGLISVCEEEATEWEPALNQMIEYIFKMVDIYNLYDARKIARYETTLEIIREYPIQQDTIEEKKIDLEEVIAEVRSRKEYINKWATVEDIESELEQIKLEKEMMEDSYTKDLKLDIEGDGGDEGDL